MLSDYDKLLLSVFQRGELRTNRTGIDSHSLFAPQQLRYSLSDNRVPLITSKQVAWKMATKELLWMLSGSTQIADIGHPAMERVWANWANADGDIGPTYGAQYRDAGGTLTGRVDESYGVDQLARVIDALVKQPDTRRAVISLWSAPELDLMALEPCMVLFQFSLRGANYDKLHLHVYQRSADMMLGVPFDLYQAGLLTHLVARELTKITGIIITGESLVWSAGDVHIYKNQFPGVRQQLIQAESAEFMQARVTIDPYPALRLLNNTIEAGHINITNYNPQPAISAPIAI